MFQNICNVTKRVIQEYVSDELLRLSKLVQELSIQRGEVVTHLSEVHHNLAVAVNHRKKERRCKNNNKACVKEGATFKATSEKATAQDSRGEILSIGNTVGTVTQGKYFARKAKIFSIEGTVTIQYLNIKKETWRLSHNLLKISDTIQFSIPSITSRQVNSYVPFSNFSSDNIASSSPASSNTRGVLSPDSPTTSVPAPTTTISHKRGGTHPNFGIYVGGDPLTTEYKLSTPSTAIQTTLNFEVNAISILQRLLCILSGVALTP